MPGSQRHNQRNPEISGATDNNPIESTHLPPSPQQRPPSPSQSMSLTLSTSPSNVSPSTPPRGRYPRALGRVPLHRRGTSRTYETLDDLLREAGYKETRIFTPETERLDADADERTKRGEGGSRMAGGVGMVVGFLAGLMPGSRSSSLQREAASPTGSDTPHVPQLRPRHSPPHSPLAHKQKQKCEAEDDLRPVSFLSRTTARSSAEDSQPHSHFPSLLPDCEPPHRRRLYPDSRPLHRSTHPPVVYSRAHAYLRHVASAPSMGNGAAVVSDKEREKAGLESPPLPQTWLGNVARAVLFSGSGTHIGGPNSRGRSARVKAPIQRHRRTRPSLTDRTNTVHGNNTLQLVNPCAQIQNTRSRRSEEEVSRTRVMCSSAPGSRSGSTVRGARERKVERDRAWVGLGISMARDGERKEKGGSEHQKRRGRTTRRVKQRDKVPILARTTAEGDVHVMSSPGRQLGCIVGESEESDSDEEDGELDLARMLVPPKRQNSIRSLRKHLNAESDIGGGNLPGSLRGKWFGTEAEDFDGKDVWGHPSRRRKGVTADDEVYSSTWGGSASTKRRLGIPAFGM